MRYHEREGIITMLGIEELPEKDGRIVLRARRLQRYLTQPLQLSASHAGIPGTFAPLGDCLGHREAFLLGQDDVPEAPRYRRSTSQNGMP